MILTTDSEIRQRVLQYLYENRKAGKIIEVDIVNKKSILDLECEEAKRILKQLKNKDYVTYTDTASGPTDVSINDGGVGVIEGDRESGGNVTNYNTINTSGDAAIANIGDSNQSTVNIANAISELVQKIEAADASEEEREEAKTLLSRALNNPLIAGLLSGAISGITSGAMMA